MTDRDPNLIARREGPELGADPPTGFARRAAVVTGVVGLAVVIAAVLVRAADVFFLAFLAVLLAVLLRSAADALARATGLRPGWALGLVVVGVAALLAGGAYAIGTTLAGQADQLATDLPRSAAQVREYLRQSAWGRWALGHTPTADDLLLGDGGSTAGAVSSFFSTTLGLLGNLLVLVFLTLYLAATPRTYIDGLLRLVPPPRRDRGGQVVAAVGYHLRWWLAGRLTAMLVVGVVVGVGLWAVGVPQFLVLALFAAAVNSVPYLGPVAAAVPGLLLALIQGPTAALWAAGVYLLAQTLDNYLVTPLVQQRTVNMPPVLSILAVVLAGALVGVLGLIVATPLAVVAMVAVKMLYVEDVLGDRLDMPGAEPHPVPA